MRVANERCVDVDGSDVVDDDCYAKTVVTTQEMLQQGRFTASLVSVSLSFADLLVRHTRKPESSVTGNGAWTSLDLGRPLTAARVLTVLLPPFTVGFAILRFRNVVFATAKATGYYTNETE